MVRASWTTEEHQDILNGISFSEYKDKYQNGRTEQAFVRRKQHLFKGDIPVEITSYTFVSPPEGDSSDGFVIDKKEGETDWREVNRQAREWQRIKEKGSSFQDEATVVFDTERRIKIIALSDTHIGSWGTDYDLFERITDEILSVPNLYVILAGDLQQMAIRLRSVMEIMDNLMDAEMQDGYIESWLATIQHRVLLAGWDNHSVMRQEQLSGSSKLSDLLARRVVFFDGIGHANIVVGGQTYRLAMSHKFPNTSKINPVYGPQKYIQANPSIEIAVAGDSHVPGVMSFEFAGEKRLAVNCGSTQTNSRYTKRHFTLHTAPVFPVIVLSPNQHIFTSYWNMQEAEDNMQDFWME